MGGSTTTVLYQILVLECFCILVSVQLNLTHTSSSDDIRSLHQELNTLRRDYNNVLSDLANIRKSLDVIQPVAFTACLTKDTSIGILQTIIYDHVITNVGNTYDPRHGIFRAPVKGLYHMSLTSISNVDNAIFVEMVKDGQRLIHTYSGGRDLHSSSASVNVVLEAGSDIWCRHYRDSNAVTINAQGSGTCFSGFLLNRLV